MAGTETFLPSFDTCPACHEEGLQPIRAGGEVNFACTTCGCCWHLELGWVRRVDPGSCPACRDRGVCLGVTLVDLREPLVSQAESGSD